jgi:hypothetical protein
MAFSMRRFQDLVNDANWHFAWFKESSLTPLISALGGPYNAGRGDDVRDLVARGREVRAAIARIDEAKQTKYFKAFDYLASALHKARFPAAHFREAERMNMAWQRATERAASLAPAKPVVTHVNRAAGRERFGNCALCAVAKLLDTDSLGVSHDQSDEYFGAYARHRAIPGAAVEARYASLVDQLNGIEHFLRTVGFRTNRIGDVGRFVDDVTLVRQMSADLRWTKYIVYLQYGDGGYAGHYNYAEIGADGRPRFFDYQQDYPGSPRGTTVGFQPLWPRDAVGDVADVDEDSPANCIAIRAVR